MSRSYAPDNSIVEREKVNYIGKTKEILRRFSKKVTGNRSAFRKFDFRNERTNSFIEIQGKAENVSTDLLIGGWICS